MSLTLMHNSEDSQLPGLVLRTPMFMMLDSLKAEDLSTRRAGEAWMRCSLKSYLRLVFGFFYHGGLQLTRLDRILDPLLFTLLDPAVKHYPTTLVVAGVHLPVIVYHSTFDQARVHHVLDDLLSLARFGGQGFIRIAKGSFLKHTLDPAFRERVRACEHSPLSNSAYGSYVSLVHLSRARDAHLPRRLDRGPCSVRARRALSAVGGQSSLWCPLSFLRAEPAAELVTSLGPLNHHIHSVVAELLQVILSRGEAEVTGLKAIESALTSRLFLCVHRSELDLQNKLLHVLHSVVHAVGGTTKRHQKGALSTDEPPPESTDAQPLDLSHDEMFVRVVSDAVSTQHNNAVIHHWIDFLLMTIPQFRRALHSIVFPLIDCLVTRLRTLVLDFQRTYTAPRALGASSEATDAEYTVLMNALERLLLIAVSEALAAAVDDEAPRPAERVMSEGGGGGGGLLGYMTGVLGSSEMEPSPVSEESKVSLCFPVHPSQTHPAASQTKQAALGRLRDAVNLLLFSWDVTSTLEAVSGEDPTSSQTYFLGRVKIRARKALERIYKASPSDVLDDIVVCWDKSRFGPVRSRDSFWSPIRLMTPIDVGPREWDEGLCHA